MIREAVTNVVRHSDARTCTITVTEERVVTRRRVGLGSGAGGSGLPGLDAGSKRPAGGSGWTAPGQGTRVVAVLGRAAAEPARRPPDARVRSNGRRVGRPGDDPVLLADDQALIRQALAALLHLEADIEVVGQAADVATAVAAGRGAGRTWC